MNIYTASLATTSVDKVDDALSVQEFNVLRTFLASHSGLYLSDDKTYLAQARLPQVAKNHNFASLHQLVNNMGSPTAGKLREEIAEAMATPETFFFRDTKPFDIVKNDLLPKLMEARAHSKTLRIWSAACSSGQESYSLAMIINELGLWQQGWKVEIWATDFSKKILDRAKAAEYTQFEVQRGLPIQLLVKYFEKEGAIYRIKPELKSRIQFQEFNLLQSMSGLRPFDIIMCRNVLFYFDVSNKRKVLDQGIATCLAKDGALFLGTAETVMSVSEKLIPDPVIRGIYRLK
ncbi:Chemotaxis protein methyltransferase [Candidatus Bealeia paramacronuclearis]|uniref:protein-glutamate O-methyltransferase n=1 Tax=Candidatus Bealeia paramacronuclearis TaxID=1921001 RepID=A0ABZ2C320_9PROT|nr:Chemotaxis protein methyltransferase [Candidatus Bealeia paramacronuclearis]